MTAGSPLPLVDIEKRLARVNWLGTYSLYRKETLRFIKVYNQTLLAPAVNALLFLAVFNLAVGRHASEMNGVPFAAFMVSGLIAMSAMQNAFANTSSSFTMGKVLGTIVDYLTPPLSAGQIAFAMAASGVTRGLAVAAVTGGACYVFVPFDVVHPFAALGYLALSSCVLALAGLIAGIFADSFDQMAAATSYVITPLAFLSGTFYPVDSLPPFWRALSQYNPFFHMINGFRYGMTGVAEGDLGFGLALLFVTAAALATVSYAMLRTGYRIKN